MREVGNQNGIDALASKFRGKFAAPVTKTGICQSHDFILLGRLRCRKYPPSISTLPPQMGGFLSSRLPPSPFVGAYWQR
ncbi:hypothetical protein M7M4_13180 [Corynebacterium pseudogenitalium]